MRATTSDSYLAKINSWATERHRAGPGTWTDYNRNLLYSLQSAGGTVIAGVAQGADLFNQPPSWEANINYEEALRQDLQDAFTFVDPFANLTPISIITQQIPPPQNPGAQLSLVSGPALGSGLGNGLQTVPLGQPLVGAPQPVSSAALAAKNAPPFMNPDPLLRPSAALPEPGSVVSLNPSSAPPPPLALPPPPGGLGPPPPPLPGRMTEEAAELQASRKVARLVRELYAAKKRDKQSAPAPTPPQPSSSRSGFPPSFGPAAQQLALRIGKYSRPDELVRLQRFQDRVARLRSEYSGLVPFDKHADEVRARLQRFVSTPMYEPFLSILHLPFDGSPGKHFPWLVQELTSTLNGIRESLGAAEKLAEDWATPVSEQNFRDLANGLPEQMKGNSSTALVRLFEASELLSGGLTAPDAKSLPAIQTLAELARLYEQRGATDKIASEYKLWSLILNESLREPGVDYARGLDHPVLKQWFQYAPLTVRYESFERALIVGFTADSDEAEQAIRDYIGALRTRVNALKVELLGSIISRYAAINRTVQDLAQRILTSGAAEAGSSAASYTLAYCVEAAERQQRTWTLFRSDAVLFSGSGSAHAELANLFRSLWKAFMNEPEGRSSWRTISGFLENPDLVKLLPDDLGSTLVSSELVQDLTLSKEPRFRSELLWINACEGCGIATYFCKQCVQPCCERCIGEGSHECQKLEHDEYLVKAGELLHTCQLDVPKDVGQVVLDDQEVIVGEKRGQLLGFEYACLQACQLTDNANLFHLASLSCPPSARLAIRYLRVTVHSVIPFNFGDEINILLNGEKVAAQQIFYGQPDGRAPLLRSRSLVIPSGAQISWHRPTDRAWLHGTVAYIPTPTNQELSIRLQLPPQLQPRTHYTKNVTASLELILTAL